jgi:surface carbohydrate biosynthesis protein
LLSFVPRILRITKTILNPEKLVWKLPPRADLVVYDQVGSVDLERIILRDLPFQIFPVRNEFFYVHPLIAGMAFWNWFVRKLSPRQAYELACLSASRPKVVVTYMDNNPNFGPVIKALQVPSFSIQNGFRTHDCAQRMRELPAVYCFGPRDVDLYASHNVPASRLQPVGSIKASYFLDQVAPSLDAGLKYDICLISSYQPGMERADYHEAEEYRKQLSEGTIKMCQFLARLMNEKALKVIVAGWQKPGENQGEIEFYKSIFGDDVRVVSAHEEYLSSYHLAYQSQVVLSYCSTLGFEALSWGRKAFFFYMPNEKNYRLDDPHSALFQILEGSYEEFCVKLNTILDMSPSQYRNEVRVDAQYAITSEGEPAYKVLRHLIQRALGVG